MDHISGLGAAFPSPARSLKVAEHALDGLCVQVVHYTPLAERRAHLEKELARHGIDPSSVRWILEHDREAITPSEAGRLVGVSDGHGLSMVSVILKHLDAFRHAAAHPQSHHLVLEDDVTLAAGFLPRLHACLTELPPDWDMLFVGSGQGMHIPWWRRTKERRVHFRGHRPTWWGGAGTSRCCEAYLVSPAFATRFLESPEAAPPYRRAIDWIMAEAGHRLQTRSWWCEPALAFQGRFESWTKDPVLNPGTQMRTPVFGRVKKRLRQWVINGLGRHGEGA